MSKSNSLMIAAMTAFLAACEAVPPSGGAAGGASPQAAASAPPAVAQLTVSLGTATPGGGFPIYGAAFAATVSEADPTITIEARNTKGSAENIPLLEQGKLDLALVQGEAAYEALNRRPTPTNIKIVWAMYSAPGMFVVNAKSPYRKITDLKGKTVVWGAKGSGLVLLGGLVVDGMGMNRDRDFKSVYLERAADGPPMVQTGKAAALWGGGTGWPGFTAMANSAGGARFLVPSKAEIDRILAKHKFLKRVTVPAGSYKGIAQDLQSVGSYSFVFARADLPDGTVYRIAQALHRGEEKFAARLAQAKESTAWNTYNAVADRSTIHPGTMLYLKYAGIAK